MWLDLVCLQSGQLDCQETVYIALLSMYVNYVYIYFQSLALGPSSVKLKNKGDLSFFNKMDEGKGKSKPRGQYRWACMKLQLKKFTQRFAVFRDFNGVRALI